MTRRCRKTLVLSIVALLVGVLSATAGDRRLQAVTFAQFNYVTSVAASMTHVYFATTEGIIRYNKLQRRWEEPLTGAESIRDEALGRVWANTFDDKLYVQTDVGLYEYDIFLRHWYPISELPAFDRSYKHIDPPDDLLPPVGENYFGQGRLVDQSGRNYRITDMIADQSGDFWLGTWGHGPAEASSSSRQVEFLTFGLIQNRVNTIFLDDSEIWVGGDIHNETRTGISMLNLETLASTQIESGLSSEFPVDDINNLLVDSAWIYIATDHGLLVMNRRTLRVERHLERRDGLPGERVVSLAEHKGKLYVGTDNGLGVVVSQADSTYRVLSSEFDQETIYDLTSAGKYLWIASTKGAYRFRPETGKLQRYRDPEQVLFSRVYAVEASDGYLWFAADGGIVRLDSQTGKHLVLQDQVSRLHRRALAANEWLAATSSDRGVMVFFFDDEGKVRSREFTIDDGLVSANVYALALDGDYLWIGSDRGLTRMLWNDPHRVD